jgi:hypothetical protein
VGIGGGWLRFGCSGVGNVVHVVKVFVRCADRGDYPQDPLGFLNALGVVDGFGLGGLLWLECEAWNVGVLFWPLTDLSFFVLLKWEVLLACRRVLLFSFNVHSKCKIFGQINI